MGETAPKRSQMAILKGVLMGTIWQQYGNIMINHQTFGISIFQTKRNAMVCDVQSLLPSL